MSFFSDFTTLYFKITPHASHSVISVPNGTWKLIQTEGNPPYSSRSLFRVGFQKTVGKLDHKLICFLFRMLNLQYKVSNRVSSCGCTAQASCLSQMWMPWFCFSCCTWMSVVCCPAFIWVMINIMSLMRHSTLPVVSYNEKSSSEDPYACFFNDAKACWNGRSSAIV